MEHPRKRSNPAEILRQQQAIIDDLEMRLPPDSEAPESRIRRHQKFGGPPIISGGKVIGNRVTRKRRII